MRRTSLTSARAARAKPLVAVLLSSVLAFALLPSPVSARGRAPRPFGGGSYWNRPIPRDAPVDPDSDQIIGYLVADNDLDYVTLAGASSSGAWGMPIYWARRGSPTYDVQNTCSYTMPREFDHIRIPRAAQVDPTSDAEMTVFDRRKGRVYAMYHAAYDASDDTWSACGGTVYYWRSNGLDGRLPQSNEERNFGHRGFPPSTYAVRFDEVRSGAIRHVLKIAVDTTKCEHVFPAVGDECGTDDEYAPPEGTLIRIRPSFRLKGLGLSHDARLIARALKRYGAIIGDQSGGDVVLKLENTVAEGRGFLWRGRLTMTSLKAIPLGAFEVVRLGYRG